MPTEVYAKGPQPPASGRRTGAADGAGSAGVATADGEGLGEGGTGDSEGVTFADGEALPEGSGRGEAEPDGSAAAGTGAPATTRPTTHTNASVAWRRRDPPRTDIRPPMCSIQG
ncbi:hypothetical protein Afil01_28600 [Actinorhabdospora filicis]|uniref:Uncharacterized protein n=1 Tax=Actinorhabdospora filicis TaxID=1785913 RepID=A0A9W6W9J2_9ACTN|nr:hypothetical protein Afil01_28600 [Actinorhabdospora filicis]